MNLKDIIYRVVVVLLTILTILLFCYHNYILATAYKLEPPTGDPTKEPVVIRTTCYTADEGAVCSSGIKPHYGVIAGAKEWGGMVACLYTFKYVDGKPVPDEFIGFFEVLDTGNGIDTDSDGIGDSIKNGQSIDVYVETGNAAEEWIATYGDYTMLYLVDGKG
jgi:hypothetical protein